MSFVVFRTPDGARLSRLSPTDPVLEAAEVSTLMSAEAVLADARAEAERIRAEALAAFEAERRRGYEDGLAEAHMEQAERMIETVSRTVDYFGKVEERMVDLVMQAVQRIISDFDDRERVIQVVKNALAVARNQKQMTLRIHPTRVDLLKSGLNDILAAYPGVGYLDVVPDPRLDGDACILESEIGVVEASMSGQIEALRAAFRKVLGARI